MRKFVRDIARLTRLRRQRVIYDDRTISRRPERACREGTGLKVFELHESFSWDQLVSGSDLNSQQPGKNLRCNGLSGADSQL